jgi:hypothetical protein
LIAHRYQLANDLDACVAPAAHRWSARSSFSELPLWTIHGPLLQGASTTLRRHPADLSKGSISSMLGPLEPI